MADYTGVVTHHESNDNSHINRHSFILRPTLSRKLSDSKTHVEHSEATNNSLLRVQRLNVPPRLSDSSYDTDGGLASPVNPNRHHHHHHQSSNNYEHLISPRLPLRRHIAPLVKQNVVAPIQHRPSHKISNNDYENQDEKEEESLYNDDERRRNIRLTRRVQHPASRPRPSIIIDGVGSVAAPLAAQPLRLIFMRHGERANQALGADWFSKAFINKTYKAYDRNLPSILPKRHFDQHYEFDVPLTVRGLKTARLTGHSMLKNNFNVDVCLSSVALRCVQTCERILTGMDRRDRIPIRLEPGLLECPHLNHKIVDSFMTKKELVENRYNIKLDYKALVPKINVPETLDEYFERSAAVIRAIIDRYAPHGGTVLIVTHAPGLLALPDGIKGIRPNSETFYRNVATFPPLAVFLAEYDGSKWRYSDQPYNIAV